MGYCPGPGLSSPSTPKLWGWGGLDVASALAPSGLVVQTPATPTVPPPKGAARGSRSSAYFPFIQGDGSPNRNLAGPGLRKNL